MQGVGELEEAVMDVLWQAQSPLTVRVPLACTGDADGVLLHFARSASDHESTILRRALEERKNP